jgi:hypothetical protein
VKEHHRIDPSRHGEHNPVEPGECCFHRSLYSVSFMSALCHDILI